ncbi:hypothetical protein [Terribacillus sp. DMT04]|uniref:hypothetical protein n=1 Tax=Terribacillus sp. DMT04 TaxID=2850441 RepID=UPI001C2C5B01|nr:hypothetical protein [Terribacillus sp. DMT04]QXE02828.1 hypothetical protein KS242_06515 [Terribacillus sp. DMT04]
MSLFLIGVIGITAALLIIVDKDKYKWLIAPAGFKNNHKASIIFYAFGGAALIICDVINLPYIIEFILPAFIACLSLFTILIVRKRNDDKPVG